MSTMERPRMEVADSIWDLAKETLLSTDYLVKHMPLTGEILEDAVRRVEQLLRGLRAPRPVGGAAAVSAADVTFEDSAPVVQPPRVGDAAAVSAADVTFEDSAPVVHPCVPMQAAASHREMEYDSHESSSNEDLGYDEDFECEDPNEEQLGKGPKTREVKVQTNFYRPDVYDNDAAGKNAADNRAAKKTAAGKNAADNRAADNRAAAKGAPSNGAPSKRPANMGAPSNGAPSKSPANKGAPSNRPPSKRVADKRAAEETAAEETADRDAADKKRAKRVAANQRAAIVRKQALCIA